MDEVPVDYFDLEAIQFVNSIIRPRSRDVADQLGEPVSLDEGAEIF